MEASSSKDSSGAGWQMSKGNRRRVPHEVPYGKYEISKGLEVFLDLETVWFSRPDELEDYHKSFKLVCNISRALHNSAKNLEREYIFAKKVTAYIIADGRENVVKRSLSRWGVIFKKGYKRELICKGHGDAPERQVQLQDYTGKQPLTELDMLNDIGDHAVTLQKQGLVRRLMVISGDPFFMELVMDLEKGKRGGFRVFADFPEGFVPVSMEQ